MKFYQTLISTPSKLNVSISETRQRFEKMMATFPAASDIAMKDILIGKIPATWIHAPHATKKRIILFFHGGGYMAGSTASHQDFLGRLSRATGLYILGVNYRLAPEHPFPAALEDAQNAYHFLLEQHYSPEQIIVAGTSAGGGLAFSLLFTLKEQGKTLPSAVLGLCPWLDLSLSEDSIARNHGKDIISKERLQSAADCYLHVEHASQSRAAKNPFVSPLFGDPKGFPPTFIMIGTRELLFDEGVRFSKKLTEANVPVSLDIGEDMFHTWFLYASQIPEGQEAIERMKEFIASR
jgi:acetyl esterase/lipase